MMSDICLYSSKGYFKWCFSGGQRSLPHESKIIDVQLGSDLVTAKTTAYDLHNFIASVSGACMCEADAGAVICSLCLMHAMKCKILCSVHAYAFEVTPCIM